MSLHNTDAANVWARKFRAKVGDLMESMDLSGRSAHTVEDTKVNFYAEVENILRDDNILSLEQRCTFFIDALIKEILKDVPPEIMRLPELRKIFLGRMRKFIDLGEDIELQWSMAAPKEEVKEALAPTGGFDVFDKGEEIVAKALAAAKEYDLDVKGHSRSVQFSSRDDIDEQVEISFTVMVPRKEDRNGEEILPLADRARAFFRNELAPVLADMSEEGYVIRVYDNRKNTSTSITPTHEIASTLNHTISWILSDLDMQQVFKRGLLIIIQHPSAKP